MSKPAGGKHISSNKTCNIDTKHFKRNSHYKLKPLVKASLTRQQSSEKVARVLRLLVSKSSEKQLPVTIIRVISVKIVLHNENILYKNKTDGKTQMENQHCKPFDSLTPRLVQTLVI